MTYANPLALADNTAADISYFRAEELADALDVDVSRRAETIATRPTDEQLCDALASVGSGVAENARLMAAFARGKDAFLAEVWEQINDSFIVQAELAIIGESHEIMSDWD